MRKHFLIFTNKYKDPELRMTERIRTYLEQRGQKVSLRIKEEDWKQEGSCTKEEQWDCAKEEQGDCGENTPYDAEEKISCMLVLGGDGTVLEAVREQRNRKIPLIGVNLGTLGFLTQIEHSDLEMALNRLIAGDYKQESRMMLQGTVHFAQGHTEQATALNDIAITRSGSLKIIRLRIYVNGLFLNEYHADGVIVTTPTGSTGYNLSAGGPIVEPAAQLLMLTPICPHTLNQRSIILSAEDEIAIEIPPVRENLSQMVEVCFDGAGTRALSTGDRIVIQRSGECAEFIQLSEVSFLETLHQKMKE